MALGFDAANSGHVSDLTITVSLAVTTGDLLVVGVVGNDGSVAGLSAAWNTTEALTQLVAKNTGAGNPFAELWYRVAPSTGTHDCVVVLTGSTAISVGVVALSGAHQTTPFPHAAASAAANGTHPLTVDVASAADEWVIDAGGIRGGDPGATPGSGQTTRVDQSGSINMSTKDGAATVTMSWEPGGNVNWATVAGSVQPAGAPAGPTTAEKMAAIAAHVASGGMYGRRWR